MASMLNGPDLLRLADATLDDRERISLAHRMLANADRSGDCWIWLGCKLSFGYGSMGFRNRTHLVHRLSYELFVGPIEPGNVIDHVVCDNPSCFRPDHLRQTTQPENVRRAYAKIDCCPHGHSYEDPRNVAFDRQGHRRCKACRNEKARARRRAAALLRSHDT